MPLSVFLARVREEVPHCVAAALVDLDRGAIVEADADESAQDLVELAAVAAPELLSGPDAPVIDALVARDETSSPFREVTLVASNRLHVWLRPNGAPRRALLVLCALHASLGMVLARARVLRPALDEVLA